MLTKKQLYNKNRYIFLKENNLCVQCAKHNDTTTTVCSNCIIVKKRCAKLYDKTEKGIEVKRKASAKFKKTNKGKAAARKYTNNKRKNNIQFKLATSLRNRLRGALKKNLKVGSAIENLSCSLEALKKYLESKFKDGMSWDNYGNGLEKWNIDHIKPLASFDLTDRRQLKEACIFTNLQPMWYIDNLKKGKTIALDL